MQETERNLAKSMSLRDPAGTLYQIGEELIRWVHPHGEEAIFLSMQSKTVTELISCGFMISHWKINNPEKYSHALGNIPHFSSESTLIAQEKLPFVNYPSEWSPEMLRAAAKLTLDLAENLQHEGLGLKDATPYNIIFSNSNPVFVDILSVEKRDPKDSLWLPYSQFLRCFINPLLLHGYFGIPLAKSFFNSQDGITPQEVYRHCGWLKKFQSPFLSLATLPTLFERLNKRSMSSKDRVHIESSVDRASFTLKFLFRRLRKTLDNLPSRSKSQANFGSYMEETLPYTIDQFKEKESVVERYLSQISPANVLDIGCNDGHFSRMAARLGSQVVAIDSEPGLIDEVWKQNQRDNLKILPLVINIAQPSPAMGWNNEEQISFLSRAEGKFDLVLMLAVLHHLVATAGIPMDKVLELASRLTQKWLLIEWVSPKDKMFQKVGLGKDFTSCDENAFKAASSRYFSIESCQQLGNATRALYLLKKRV